MQQREDKLHLESEEPSRIMNMLEMIADEQVMMALSIMLLSTMSQEVYNPS